MKLYKLRPAFKDYIWGGTKLKTKWNKKADTQILAESWELSFHPDGASVIEKEIGELADSKVGQYLNDAVSPCEYGTDCENFPFFPVLIKFIDAADNLSVQVHPSDDYALKNEGQFGKTEMWYICDREEGAGIYCGFTKNLTPEEYASRISDGTLTEVLKFFEVEPGECYFIPAGTVHAIGKGTTICEIQQNSNLTYRVYDFGRVGKDGKPRELHIEKAKKVSELTPYACLSERGESIGNRRFLASCPYFNVTEIKIDGKEIFDTDTKSFNAFTVISGSGEISLGDESMSFGKGDTFFATAGNDKITICGKATVLQTRV